MLCVGLSFELTRLANRYQLVVIRPSVPAAYDGITYTRAVSIAHPRRHWKVNTGLDQASIESILKDWLKSKQISECVLSTLPILLEATDAEVFNRDMHSGMHRNLQLRITRCQKAVVTGGGETNVTINSIPINALGALFSYRDVPDVARADSAVSAGWVVRVPASFVRAHRNKKENTPKLVTKLQKVPVIERVRVALPWRSEDAEYVTRTLYGMSDVSFLQQARGASMPMFLRGVPGGGKSMMVEAAFGRDVHMVVGTSDTEVSDFIGTYVQRADGSGYDWVDGPLLRAMDTGSVLFVDEVGLIDPRVLSVLYPVMDGRNEVVVTANPARGTVIAKDGFYVVGATNPDAPGVRLSEALLSRFALQMDVSSDFEIALELNVPEELVAAARNLDDRRRVQEINWSPQLRELTTFLRTEAVFGRDVALAALVAACPENDRLVVQDVLSRSLGVTVVPLALREEVKK